MHQLNAWRKEPERKSCQPDYRLRRTAPELGQAMNTNTADHRGNQTRQRIFRPWRSPEWAGFAANLDAKAFAPDQPKTHKCLAVNAFVSRVLVVVDFCAKMAAGHAQKGAKTKTSAGQTC